MVASALKPGLTWTDERIATLPQLRDAGEPLLICAEWIGPIAAARCAPARPAETRRGGSATSRRL
jgi:hypothetical protein